MILSSSGIPWDQGLVLLLSNALGPAVAKLQQGSTSPPDVMNAFLAVIAEELHREAADAEALCGDDLQHMPYEEEQGDYRQN
ncbi:MAG TPA: hypothetical protein VHA78_01665 [Candidatus Peribacteraceae bacterium]|nr:hypothetical protein [Candidatus Peribacteraceae bacterium]